MKKIDVGCAIITVPAGSFDAGRYRGRLLIARRLPGSHLGGFWEFPGGKRRDGEAFEACLEREVAEELGVRIRAGRFLGRAEHAYLSRRVSLHFYFCDWISGHPVCRECLDFAWVLPEDLRQYRFPPADAAVIHELLSKRLFYFGKRSGGG